MKTVNTEIKVIFNSYETVTFCTMRNFTFDALSLFKFVCRYEAAEKIEISAQND